MKVKKVKKETKPDDSNNDVADDDDENGYDDETVAGDDIVVETVDEDEDSDGEEENTDESPPLDEEEVRELLADEEPAPTNTPSMPTITETVEEDDDDEPDTPMPMTGGTDGTPATAAETPYPFTPFPQTSERRSTRSRNPPQRLNYTQWRYHDHEWKVLEQCHNITVEKPEDCQHREYTQERARLVAQLMMRMRRSAEAKGEWMFNFGQQHQLQKGLKLFGLKGEIAAKQELSQLIKRNCYEPIDASTMTDTEKKKVQRSMMLLTEKSSGCLLYTSPSPRDKRQSRMPSSA